MAELDTIREIIREWNRNPDYGYGAALKGLREGEPPDPELVDQRDADIAFAKKYGIWAEKNKKSGTGKRESMEAMAKYDAQEMVAPKGKGKKKKKSKGKDKEELRAIIQAALADKTDPYVSREMYARGEVPEGGHGFADELARERGLGYGQPREQQPNPQENLRTLVSALESQQGVSSSALPTAGAEMMEDPGLMASASPVPTGGSGPVDIQALMNEASGVGRAGSLEDVVKLMKEETAGGRSGRAGGSSISSSISTRKSWTSRFSNTRTPSSGAKLWPVGFLKTRFKTLRESR